MVRIQIVKFAKSMYHKYVLHIMLAELWHQLNYSVLDNVGRNAAESK